LSSKQPNSVRNCLAKYEEWPPMMIKQTFAEENAVSEILIEGWTRKKIIIVFRLKKFVGPILISHSTYKKFKIIMLVRKVSATNLIIFMEQT
jgi:hypothetical protein